MNECTICGKTVKQTMTASVESARPLAGGTGKGPLDPLLHQPVPTTLASNMT